LKLLGIVGLVLVGLLWGEAETMSSSQRMAAPVGNLTVSFGLALIGVLWSYGGWQHASFVAGETIDPRRTVPRAMILGALVVAGVYLLTNLAYMFLLPVSAIAASESVAADAISTVIPFGGALMALVIAISVVGTAGIYTLSAPRIYHAMAADGIFFRKLAEVHPTFRTPVNAIVVQSAWSIFLLLFWGTFEDLITYVVSVDWVFFAMTGACVFIFRRQGRGEKGGYRTWGYPVTPLVFIGISSLFVLNTYIERPLHAGVGAVFMALGVGVYLYFKKVAAGDPVE
jgi:APA family basic amino acid/polyamine antiporter